MLQQSLGVKHIALPHQGEEGYWRGNMPKELTLEILDEAINSLDEQPVHSDILYIDGINVCEMPEDVKARIKWAFDHIYISSNIERLKDADL